MESALLKRPQIILDDSKSQRLRLTCESSLLTLETLFRRLGQSDPKDQVTELAFGQNFPGYVGIFVDPTSIKSDQSSFNHC